MAVSVIARDPCCDISQPRSRQLRYISALETPSRYQPRSAQDDALRFARTCYDHLAGRLGVAITDALMRKKYLVLSDEGGELTMAGKRFLTSFGSVLVAAPGSRRIYCRPCLDWSERRYHIAGHVGACRTESVCRRPWGPHDGMKRSACVAGAKLDMQTLLWTRGRDCPLSRLESRMKFRRVYLGR